MNMPLVLLNRRRRGTGFNPASLFGLNEQGVWYDPSDVANLAWRRNLLTWTEQFDNAAWTKFRSAVTANAGTDPLGGTTADKLVPTASLTAGQMYNAAPISAISGASYAGSVYVKAAELGFAFVSNNARASSNQAGVCVNLATGARSNEGANGTYTVTDAGNGWWRVSAVAAATSANGYLEVHPLAAAGLPGSYTGDGTSGILIWGAQLELGSVATDYQRITDVNTEVIERFPTATLYQDTIGTIPVTTPGQAVALMLDKSRGLTLGSETVANPGNPFVSTTGYSAGGSATISVDTGRLKVSQTTGFTDGVLCALPNSTFTTTTVVSFDVDLGSSSFVQVQAGNGNFGSGNVITLNIFTSGTHSIKTTTLASGFCGLSFKGASAGDFFLSRVSVKSLAGNHATQATLAARPTYSIEPVGGRRNLLTWTEDFSNSFWNGGSLRTLQVTTNSTTAPDGTLTANKVVEALAAAGSVPHRVIASDTSASGQKCFSVYAKKAERKRLYMFFNGPDDGGWFDLDTGAYGAATDYPGGSVSMTPVGNGWYRCTLTPVGGSGPGTFIQLCVISDAATTFDTRVGNGTSGIYLWGAQLELGSTATAYQRVTTQYDVTEAGVPSCSYLFFDGGSDSMATGSIDFTATDKMTVWAGVRKLSDAGFQSIAELSADTNTIAGSMFIGSGTTVGDASRRTWAYGINGSAVLFGGAAVYAAPITNVLAGVYDIAAATRETEVIGRANGSDQTLSYNSAGTAGTGNFSNQPLYLGARGGTASFFNGNLFGLIVRGAASTTAQITATEAWLAPKTGVTL